MFIAMCKMKVIDDRVDFGVANRKKKKKKTSSSKHFKKERWLREKKLCFALCRSLEGSHGEIDAQGHVFP